MTFIYIIRCEKQNLFKIGISCDPEKRCKQLQTGNPFNLKIMYNFKINEKYKIKACKIEKTIHDYLRNVKNNYMKNEWFTLTNDEVVKLVKCLINSFS